MIFQFSFKSGFKNGSKNFLQGSLNLFYRLWSVRIVNSLTNFFLQVDPVICSANYVVWRRDQVFSRTGRLVVAALDEAFSHHA